MSRRQPPQRTAPKPAAPVLPSDEKMEEIKSSGLIHVSPLKLRVMQLVVTTEQEYQQADQILQEIRLSRDAMLMETDINGIIDPISTSIQKLYKLRQLLLKPFEEFIEGVELKMREFKAEERRQLREAEQARLRTEQEQRKLAREKEQAALKAKSKPLASRLMHESVQANARAEEALAQPKAEPVKAETSSARFQKKWRLTDISLLVAAVMNGTAPVEMLTVDEKSINAYFRETKPEIGDWIDGLEVYEDVLIAEKARR